jgi:hypothetical protein
MDVQAPVGRTTTLFATGPGDAGPIDAGDVRQGHIGDCYLVGALAALAAKDPNVIRDMIHPNRDAAGT